MFDLKRVFSNFLQKFDSAIFNTVMLVAIIGFSAFVFTSCGGGNLPDESKSVSEYTSSDIDACLKYLDKFAKMNLEKQAEEYEKYLLVATKMMEVVTTHKLTEAQAKKLEAIKDVDIQKIMKEREERAREAIINGYIKWLDEFFVVSEVEQIERYMEMWSVYSSLSGLMTDGGRLTEKQIDKMNEFSPKISDLNKKRRGE